MPLAQADRESKLCMGVDPFWSSLAMFATQDIVLKSFFRKRIVLGKEFLPLKGPLVLAPTHRSRWDSLMLPLGAGRRVTGRDCRFMVTVTEMEGLQGWFLNRLGCFPIDQNKPSLTSLRYAIDLMINNHQLVVFPEGHIRRNRGAIKLQTGLTRLVQMAHKKGVDVPIIPVGIAYSDPIPKPFSNSAICFEKPLKLINSGKEAAHDFNLKLSACMHTAEQSARKALGIS